MGLDNTGRVGTDRPSLSNIDSMHRKEGRNEKGKEKERTRARASRATSKHGGHLCSLQAARLLGARGLP